MVVVTRLPTEWYSVFAGETGDGGFNTAYAYRQPSLPIGNILHSHIFPRCRDVACGVRIPVACGVRIIVAHVIISDVARRVPIGAPVGILGLILPIYTIIDMIETAENVWSDSCVNAMVNKDLYGESDNG